MNQNNLDMRNGKKIEFIIFGIHYENFAVNTLNARQSYDISNPKPKGGEGGMICNPMYFVPSGVYIHLWLMAVFLA